MRTPSYERSQVLWPLWLVLPAVALIAGGMSLRADSAGAAVHILVGMMPPLGLLLVLGRLQVQLDHQALEWRFGFLGWPRWRIALADIASVDVVRTSWLDGWGIKRTRDGWLYNASGFEAVRITRHDGRVVRLGSDEPARLAAALRSRLPARR